MLYSFSPAFLTTATMVYYKYDDSGMLIDKTSGWTTTIGWVAVGELNFTMIFAVLLRYIGPNHGNIVNGVYETRRGEYEMN